MKTKFILSVLAIFVAVTFISSCSVEKRKYTSGYFLDWKKAKPAVAKNESLKRNVQAKETIIKQGEVSQVNSGSNKEVITASTDHANGIVIPNTKPLVLDSAECDVIIL